MGWAILEERGGREDTVVRGSIPMAGEPPRNYIYLPHTAPVRQHGLRGPARLGGMGPAGISIYEGGATPLPRLASSRASTATYDLGRWLPCSGGLERRGGWKGRSHALGFPPRQAQHTITVCCCSNGALEDLLLGLLLGGGAVLSATSPIWESGSASPPLLSCWRIRAACSHETPRRAPGQAAAPWGAVGGRQISRRSRPLACVRSMYVSKYVCMYALHYTSDVSRTCIVKPLEGAGRGM